jgi:Domain of unknown function (DUF1707)
MDHTDRGYPAGNLRVSDTDRDQAVAELARHFQAGRLTVTELDERSGRALRSRTGNDLAGLLADLPPDSVTASAPALAPSPADSPRPSRGWTQRMSVAPLVVGFVIAAAVVVLTRFPHGHYHPAALLPIFVALLVIRRLTRASRRGGQLLARDSADRRDERVVRGGE